MDIMMEKSKLSCRRELWWGTVRREEMTECVVPDTYPDIGRIIDSCAQVLIRAKSAADDKVTVNCEALCTVLYTGEGGKDLFRLETLIPFQVTADMPGAGGDTDILALPVLEELDIRLLNPRKILVKAGVAVEIRCFRPGEFTVSCSAVADDALQLNEGSCQASPVVDVREKTYTITEEIALPPMDGSCSRVLCHTVCVQVQDVKFVGNKLIFKGEADVSMLLEAEESPVPISLSSTVQFSQIMELEAEADRARVDVCMTGSDMSIELNEQGKNIVNVQLHMLAQATATVDREVLYIADAYSNAMQCSMKTEEMDIPTCCEETVLRDTLRCMAETEDEIGQIVCARARCCGGNISDRKVNIKLAVSCVYTDAEGELRSVCKTDSLNLEGSVPDNVCSMRLNCGEVYAVSAAGGVDLRVPVEAEFVSCTKKLIGCVASIELNEPEEKPERPALYMVPNRGGDTWELAKKYASTIELIEKSNPEPGKILMIPVQQI